MRFTGVDLSLRATGMARVDGTFVTVKPRSTLEGYWRHDDIATRVERLIAEDDPDLVIFEDYARGSLGINSTIVAAEVGGIVRRDLTRAGVTFMAIQGNTMKRYATGNGRAKKGQVFDEALAHFPATADIDEKPATHDEADAYWLRAMARAHYLGDSDGKDRAGVLARIDWPELEVRAR